MKMPDNRLKNQYSQDDQARQSILDRARFAAAMSKPHVLPFLEQSKDVQLPQAFQSLAARGMTNMEGKMLLAMFPPTNLWFEMALAPEIEYDPALVDEEIQSAKDQLFIEELKIQGTLEASNLEPDNRMRRSGFRSRKRMAISQILITGDTLEQLTDDYRIKVYRRDMYVTRRNSDTEVIYHIVRETVDPLGLSQDLLTKAGLNTADFASKNPWERLQDMYTMIQWQPQAKTWLIEQEINGSIVATSEELISPFFSTPFDLAPGEDYGRGFVEQNLGDVRTLNELEEKMLDFAAIASKILLATDYASEVRDEDLMKPSGSTFEARVSGGVIQDVAVLKSDKLQDFRVVDLSITRKEKSLGKSMLLESESQPKGDRVTATQIQRIAFEVDGALGGLYASISDDQQVPLIRRTVWQMKRDNLIRPLPPEAVELKVLTGLAALGREVNVQRLLQFSQVISQFPEAARRLNQSVMLDVLARNMGISERGLIKSDAEVQAEIESAMQQQAQQQAVETGIDTAGKIAQDVIAA